MQSIHRLPSTAYSRERDFQNFCAGRQSDRRWLKPEFKSFLCIFDRFVLCVASGSATGQFRKKCRPTLRFRIVFDNQPQCHELTIDQTETG